MNTEALDFDQQVVAATQDELLSKIDEGIKRVGEFLDLCQAHDRILTNLDKTKKMVNDYTDHVENMARAGVSDTATLHSKFQKGELQSQHFQMIGDEFDSILSDVGVLKESIAVYEALFAELAISQIEREKLSAPH